MNNEDTISRAALVSRLEYLDLLSVLVRKCIEQAPTVTPQVRHGRWIRQVDEYGDPGLIMCSACKGHPLQNGCEDDELSPFCPHCGVPMDGGEDDATN